ncbi:MAG: GNAT family N-acetyltransferase [Candidatus Thorarchaeota archaeon]
MVSIIYRNYQQGDEEQLADLFNRAFQMNGFSFIRTKKNWEWRYIQSPDFEPEMIQIAEDIDNHKLIGMVCVNPIEKINLNNVTYLNGNINDVSCHPDYIRQGISKKLMQRSIEYMQRKGCDISLLITAFNGFPRNRLYSKLGYQDFDRSYGYITFPNFYRLVRDLPLVILVLPALVLFSYLPRLIKKIFMRLSSYSKGFSYKIEYNRQHFKYIKYSDKILKSYYTGYPIHRKGYPIWARIRVPSKRHRPTYILIKKENDILGGTILTHLNTYHFKYGLKLRIGIIHELFLDTSKLNNKKELSFAYKYLIDKILKAASYRSVGLLLINVNHDNILLNDALKEYNFFKFQDLSLMILKLKDNLKLSKPEKFIFIPTYLSLGFP